jgi:hypothetical protein
MVDSSFTKSKSHNEMKDELNSLLKKKREINENLRNLMKEEKIKLDIK